MFFSAYLGSPENEARWHEALERHASWLGITAHAFSRSVADGRTFAYGWASLRPPDTAALVREDGSDLTIIPLDTLTRAEALAQVSPSGFETNAIRMDVSLETGEMRITVPLVTPEQFYQARDRRGWVFGNDLRLMMRWAGMELDERAVYAFFQYDYVPAPLTVSKTVQRIPGGYTFSLSDGGEPSLERWFDGSHIADPEPGLASPLVRLRSALDGVLARVPQSSAVHFSGGVDSGLIAARLSVLGRRDVWLQNYTPGPDDPFRDLAPRMAAHLGLHFDRVEWKTSEVPATLTGLAKEYSFPVSDAAVLPTLSLVRAMEHWPFRPAALLTGSVAGNVLEMGQRYPSWKRVFMIPRPLRWLVAQAFGLGLWRSESELARAVAVMQRSVQWPFLQAAASAQGNLLGLAYRIPPRTYADIKQTLMETYEDVTQGAHPVDRIILMSLIRHGATRCGARPYDPMRRRGVCTIHPFLEPTVLRAAFSIPLEARADSKEDKALLKQIFAESVPREWVYRARAGLPLPFSEIFSDPAVLAQLGDVVLSPRNPLMGLCRARSVERVFHRAERQESLNVGAKRFVWMFTFLSLWVSQLEL